MELASAVLLLGGLYVISNQNKNEPFRNGSKNKNTKDYYVKTENTDLNKTQEGFANIKSSAQSEYLPNTQTPVQNYPVTNTKELVDTTSHYLTPNATTDKYFNQNEYQKQQNAGVNVSNNIQQIYSMSGQYVDKSNFEHNNMVPFVGGKIKGQVYNENMAESILDNMAGTGSQTIKKMEQAPLFKPQDHVQWPNGAPNMSEFYQSRVNPGSMNSMAKPFESVHVGPGLNQGYTNEGSLGYNSGMEARDKWLDKTVDELRVKTNPKLEYSLENLEGPSYSHVQNRGIEGKIEKYRPDTFFIQNQDRWLTTTGQEKGQALRPVQEVPETSRALNSVSYTGVASATENSNYAPQNYEKSRRPESVTCDVAHSSAQGRGPHNDKDLAKRSHTNYVNNRAMLKQPDTIRSGFSGAIGAVIAPLMDAFRPSRKEEFGANVRIYGDGGSTVPDSYVLNANDVTPTTIKETTLYAPNMYYGNQVEGGGYMTNQQQPIFNQRDSTNCSSYGPAGGASTGYGDVIYTDAYKTQINNDNKEHTLYSRTNQGNTNIFNQQMNVSMPSKIDTDRVNARANAPMMMSQPGNSMTYGKVSYASKPEMHNIGCERIQPDILNAFRSNPYTQSLTTSV